MRLLLLLLLLPALALAAPAEARHGQGWGPSSPQRVRTHERGPQAASRGLAGTVAHPVGCPRRAFCGCGASVRVFGRPVRALYAAAAWLRFPSAAPAPGTAAASFEHVFVLERHLGGTTWLVYDANSGGHRTRVHARSIAGYSIVNPRA